MKGRFITLEGPEGSGKSTQAERLVARLREAGTTVVTVREPGGTRLGEVIRDLLQHDLAREAPVAESEVLLFAASRAQLVHRVILPALARGEWVISDRFMDSTTAYQGYGRGMDVEDMIEINRFAVGPAEPDLTLLLDITIDTSMARVAARTAELSQAEDRFEREERAFHERVRNGYLELAARWPERFHRIDGTCDQACVADAIWQAVQARFPGSV